MPSISKTSYEETRKYPIVIASAVGTSITVGNIPDYNAESSRGTSILYNPTEMRTVRIMERPYRLQNLMLNETDNGNMRCNRDCKQF